MSRQSSTGRPQVDDKIPNPALKTRPVIGLPLFSGMQPSAPNRWSGRIYNADDGGTYASHVSMAGCGYSLSRLRRRAEDF